MCSEITKASGDYSIREEEVKALELASSLGIPVPGTHKDCRGPGNVVVVRDKVDGDKLEKVWRSMSPDQKTDIATQLRTIVSTMRSATQAEYRIGACVGQARDDRGRAFASGGPFYNEADFNDWSLGLYDQTPHSIRKALSQSLRIGHRIVFTHAALCPEYIIVADGKIKALTSWTYAGWYPEYWEYFKFFEESTSCKDWKNYADQIFEQRYPEQLVLRQAIMRWQNPWGGS